MDDTINFNDMKIEDIPAIVQRIGPVGFNGHVVEQFRASGGHVPGPVYGHRELLLLHTTGARTKKPRVTPMLYMHDGDRYIVFATSGGSPTDPAWYHNLVAEPDVEIEIGAERIPMHATALEEPERTEIYAEQVRRIPAFANYEAATERVIPVVALTSR
jgi:deazaflavin-dependent oxidoreductase (nitroreductase family)